MYKKNIFNNLKLGRSPEFGGLMQIWEFVLELIITI
jgi:hypothetical protein